MLSVALVMSIVGVSYADTVNFDIAQGNMGDTFYEGTGAAPDSGTHWNGYRMGWGDSTYFPCYESDGTTSSPVVVTIAGGGYSNYLNSDGTGFAPKLMDSYAYSSNGTGWNVTIDHLTAGAKYDLYWYQQNGVSANSTGSFTFGGVTETATNTGQNSAFVLNDNYVKFMGVTADGAGVITGSIGNTASICGLQIMSSVPEPSACVLMGMGLFGLLAYAWRKRR
jgi:hypothetical protein